MKTYEWPGNIRELFNAIERAVILVDDSQTELSLKDLAFLNMDQKAEYVDILKSAEEKRELKRLEEIEREAIEETLEETRGHRKKAADILGISLRALQYKLKKYAEGK